MVVVIDKSTHGGSATATADTWWTDKAQDVCFTLASFGGGQAWAVLLSTDANFPFTTSGFDVGKAFTQFGAPNDNKTGDAYVLVAFG